MRRSRELKNGKTDCLEIRTFGGLCIFYQGSPITIIWESQKARLLFCYLLIANDQWTHRDKLIEMLWPGLESGNGLNNFKTTLSRLRKSFMGPSTLNPVIVQGDAVRINYAAISVDISSFKENVFNGIKLQARGDLPAARKSLEAAQDIYLGEFLPDEPFNQYISGCRTELAELYEHLLNALTKIYQTEGNVDGIEAMAIMRKCFMPAMEC